MFRSIFSAIILSAISNAQFWKTFDPNSSSNNRSFIIDYENNQFLLDGEPFRYISGSMHYFRVPREHWQDRFDKVKAAGLNAISTYIDWSRHEPEDGVYDFDGMLDFTSYIQLAAHNGLFVILRPGPYICSEKDMGGLPYWLLNKDPHMILRTSDAKYIYYVDRWMGKLLPMIKPLLYINEGSIITVQIENEYGSYYACDKNYMLHLRDLTVSYLGSEVVLYTTDGNADSFLKCGKTEGVYATVDFSPGDNVNSSFNAQRDYEPNGPLINSEYYTGGLTHWGYAFINVSSDSITSTLQGMLDMNASINFYMFHGGTNFGFTNGANMGNWYNADLTSYDDKAPVSESGNLTDKYYAIRNFIQNYTKKVAPPIPDPLPTYAYGEVTLQMVGTLFDLTSLLRFGLPVTSETPLSFEALGQAYGFVLYENLITNNYLDPVLLNVGEIKDRGYVFIDKEFVGILSRTGGMNTLAINVRPNQTLSILVENQGRLNYGPQLNDSKGLISTPLLDGANLTQWTMTSLPFNSSTPLDKVANLTSDVIKARTASGIGRCNTKQPAIYSGTFLLPENSSAVDTFLSPAGWGKGVAFINGFNLGRYWPDMGPQVTLFVPKGVLLNFPQQNQLFVLELERSPCADAAIPDSETLSNDIGQPGQTGQPGKNGACSMTLLDTHILDGNTPKPYGQETVKASKS